MQSLVYTIIVLILHLYCVLQRTKHVLSLHFFKNVRHSYACKGKQRMRTSRKSIFTFSLPSPSLWILCRNNTKLCNLTTQSMSLGLSELAPWDIGDTSSIPVSGRSPGGGHGNPLQYSCLENPINRGAWWATVHGVAKSWTRLKRLSTHIYSWLLELLNLRPHPLKSAELEPAFLSRSPDDLCAY